jgi:sugar/nucleoside kinase (ribokinase family)
MLNKGRDMMRKRNDSRVLFSGLNTVDIQFFVDEHPKANTKIKTHRNEIATGGPATNAAIACSALGAGVTLLTPVGKHAMTDFILSDLKKHGITVIDPLGNTDSKPVFASIITNETNGERTIFSHHPDNCNEAQLMDTELSTEFDVAMFDGFYPLYNQVLARKLRQKGTVTVFDGGSWKPCTEEILPHMDIAICSNDFIPPHATSKEEIVECLRGYGVSKIAITRGDKSILLYNENKIKEIPIASVKAVDTLGAGDFFHGAFCYFYACESDFESALQKAASVATLSCRYHGTRSWINELKSDLMK